MKIGVYLNNKMYVEVPTATKGVYETYGVALEATDYSTRHVGTPAEVLDALRDDIERSLVAKLQQVVQSHRETQLKANAEAEKVEELLVEIRAGRQEPNTATTYNDDSV